MKESSYIESLKTPNRDGIKKLHQKDISKPDFLAGVIEFLTDEGRANSFEGMEIAKPELSIDPVAEGYVSKWQLALSDYTNARGVWANNLMGKLTFLFGCTNPKEHKNLRKAISIGVELMQFARDSPNGELVRLIKDTARETGKEVSKEIKDVVNRHTSPKDELRRIDKIKKVKDHKSSWAKAAQDILQKIDHERVHNKPNPNENDYFDKAEYQKWFESLKTKTPKQLAPKLGDTLSKAVRRYEEKQNRKKEM